MFKLNIGCERCGYKKSARALQFHHRDPATKERKIGATLWWSGGDLYNAEIAKCDLLCANCHAEAHELLDGLPGESIEITTEPIQIPQVVPEEAPAEPVPEKEPVPA